MSLYKSFKTSDTLETEGVDLQYGLSSKGLPVKIRIARSGGANVAYLKALETATRPYRKQIEVGALDPKTAEAIMLDVCIKTVILGWENVEDEQGNVLDFTADNVRKIMTDLPDLFRDVQHVSNSLVAYREAQKVSDLGN